MADLLLFAVIGPLLLCSIRADDFVLTVLHTNDIHAHIEQFNTYGGNCVEGEECFGGVARKHTLVQKMRAEKPNVILLDGGDEFSGTLWFNIYKGRAAVTFMNYTKYDAMAIGNHEFDQGNEGLIEFLRQANFPVLAANMDVSKAEDWPNPPIFKPSTIIERGGRKIGVIGYITEDTKWLSSPSEDVIFNDVIESVRAEAQRLQSQGINILIALGHAGYEADQEIGKQVKELDLVIGGHTNTFLYNGEQPSTDTIQGPYPTVVTRDDGSTVPVIQDFAYAKYLGDFEIVFDDEGNVKGWQGNPILLDESYEQDPVVLAIVDEMNDPIEEARNKGIGRTLVFLEGDRNICRSRDCNLGNLVTDAIVKMQQQNPDDRKWASVVLSLWNGGGLRSGNIDKPIDEMITHEECTSILPFGNSADIIEIEGKYILEAFEHGIAGKEERKGQFPQISGFKIYFDSRKPAGQRLLDAYALCQDCRVPKYERINATKSYLMVTSGYLANGGDGYEPLSHYTKLNPGPTALFLLESYIEARSPIFPVQEGRIVDIAELDIDIEECSENSKILEAIEKSYFKIQDLIP